MVTDITPTLLDWIGASDAAHGNLAVDGRSLMPVLRGEAESVYSPEDIRAIEVSGNSALYKGDFKITRSMPPVGDGRWRLFNLGKDPGETTDLASKHPEILTDLIEAFASYSREVGVLKMPGGYDTSRQVRGNTTDRMLKNYPWLYLVLAAIAGASIVTVWTLARLARRAMRGAPR